MALIFLHPLWYKKYMEVWHCAITEGYNTTDAREIAELEANDFFQKQGINLEKTNIADIIPKHSKPILNNTLTKIEPPPFSFIKPKKLDV